MMPSGLVMTTASMDLFDDGSETCDGLFRMDTLGEVAEDGKY